MACVSGSIEVVQKLVQGGADTNAQDATEETPFHEACRHQYENIVVSMLSILRSNSNSSAVFRSLLRVSVFPAVEPRVHQLRFAAVFTEACFL